MFNWVKTAILMAAIMALFGIVGGMIGGKSGMLMALIFGGAMNLFSYWFSDSMVLKMYNAQQVDETDRKSTRLNSSHNSESRMPSSA
jgi:heat shock protein HtpX